MVNFGKKIVAAQHSPWQQYYIDYNSLKSLISTRSDSPTSVSEGTVVRSQYESFPSTDEVFRTALDREIETAVLFFLEIQGELASRLAMLGQKKDKLLEQTSSHHMTQQGTTSSLLMKETSDLIEEYNHVGEDLLNLIRFMELNVTAVRKILKKHDKIFKENKLTQRYLSDSIIGSSDSHLDQLYHYGGVTSLVASMEPAFRELRSLEKSTRDQMEFEQRQNGKGTHARTMSDTYYLSKILSKAVHIGSHTDHELDLEHSKLGQINPYHFEEPIMFRINVARRRLHHSSRYREVLAAQALMFERSESSLVDEEDEEKEKRKGTARQRFSSILNLLSTFLYMTNYYIVAPTSGVYAEKLGSSQALAGIIIGMTPIAALVSSFLYGWWSNHSFKHALLFAGACSLAGNILYALALPCNSLAMIIVGRYFNGFGSARAINRRYIADTFSSQDRTAASAAFVTAGALGMAVGPAIAASLGALSPIGNIWTIETAPGWVMLVLWACFLVCTLLLFEEPQRVSPVAKKEVELVNESRPLLGDEPSELIKDNVAESSPLPSLWTNIPLMMSLWIYFVLKLVLECLLSSTATLTLFHFDWDSTASGMYLAILGLLMFPANLVVAYLSRRYDDKELIMATLLIMASGSIGIVHYGSEPYTVIQYVVFSISIFLSTNALEGPNMSLLSKTIPRAWAKGTFNSGLLATEAGTFGRAVGDVFLSAISFNYGVSMLLDMTFVPVGIMVIATTAVAWRFYKDLEPVDDDDE